MRRIIEALGADYEQWHVLSRVMLKLDLRPSGAFAMDTANMAPEEAAHIKLPWGSIFFHGLTGVVLAFVPTWLTSPFLACTVLLGVVMMLIFMAVFADFHAVVISPMDYQVLAPQPISSRTYFIAKLTNVLIYTGAIGALAGGFATLSLFWKHGLLVAIAWLFALAAAAVWTTLATICAYAAILKVVRPERLRRALTTLQMLLPLAVLLPQMLFFERGYMEQVKAGGLETALTPALLLLPPGWFASLPAMAGGAWRLSETVGATLALATLFGLFAIVRGRLSLSYAQRIGELFSTAKAKRPSKWLLSGAGRFGAFGTLPPELRAAAILVRAQFRHDLHFRRTVLNALSMILIYMALVIGQGGLIDPFTATAFGQMFKLFLIHLAVTQMPLSLAAGLPFSDSFRAAWIFFATPANLAKLAIQSVNCLTLFFLIPLLLIVGAIFAWQFDALWHAALHTSLLGLIAYLGMQSALLASPRLPFSEPPRKGYGSRLWGVIIGASAFSLIVLPFLLLAAYSRPAYTAATLTALILACAAMHVLVLRRIDARIQRLEFVG